MHHHKMINDLLVSSTIKSAFGTDRLALKQLQMRQQMQTIFIALAVSKLHATDAAGLEDVLLLRHPETVALWDRTRSF